MTELGAFVETFGKQKPRLRRRMGTVVGIASDYSLTVTVAGDSTQVTGVKYFGHYTPRVGAQVWLDTDGVDVIAVGALAGLGGSAVSALFSKTSDQNIANNTLEQVTMSSIDHDPAGMIDNAADRITVSMPGIYLIAAGASFAANATGYREIQAKPSSGDPYVVARQAATPTTNARVTASVIRSLSQGATVELHARQTSGGALAVAGDSADKSFTWLGVTYLGPAA